MSTDAEHSRLVERVLGYLEGRPEYHTIRAQLGDHPHPNPVNGEMPDITAFRKQQFVIFRAFTEPALRGPEFESESRAFARSASFEHVRYHVIVPEKCGADEGLEVARQRVKEIGIHVDNIWFV
jgi:hypothetical protein